ncbi:unnamed protein product [Pleuronectes platessa]|uniref:Uncharacterized protein n=1 Tax=Pleuronectes platessa TaxID=8262 RepID=A0A9N7Y7Y7_PLEPL|nr:unnamed protein product [Pleuronectes platessa]
MKTIYRGLREYLSCWANDSLERKKYGEGDQCQQSVQERGTRRCEEVGDPERRITIIIIIIIIIIILIRKTWLVRGSHNPSPPEARTCQHSQDMQPQLRQSRLWGTADVFIPLAASKQQPPDQLAPNTTTLNLIPKKLGGCFFPPLQMTDEGSGVVRPPCLFLLVPTVG